MRAGRRGVPVLLLVVLAAGPATAQDEDAPVRMDPVVISVTRMEQRASESPASVTVITRDDIRQSASQTADDLLRQVPGFSLFRRSSSVVTHPTTQGVSLRGIGPSGASRALVLLDGIPINDPFGGWVYWNRVPLPTIERVEVVRGGGSAVWGNYALGGVVHLVSRRPTQRAALLETSYGSRETLAADLLLTEAQGPWRLAVAGRHFETEGYPVVKASRRGAIDGDADSIHRTVTARVELVPSPDLSGFLTGNYYDEDRGNGTPLQTNRTGAASFAGGARARTADGSEWSLSLFGHVQEFRSTFSSQAADRHSETLALDQTVSTTSLGGALSWSRRLGEHLLLAGLDVRWVEGETDEDVFSPAAFLRNRVAGGDQVVAGLFVQDVFRPHPRWELVGGVRVDYWRAYDGFRRDEPPPAGILRRRSFSDVDRVLLSPRAAVLFRATPSTDLRASAYQGIRVPTLNELYRPFRVREEVTVGNEHLKPERLTGGELSAHQRWGPVDARVTGFWNEVQDLVVNATQARRLPDCPPGTICRQRQNVDRARIRGVEAEVEVQPAREWRVLASYLYTDAVIVDAPPQRALEGRRLAQVPEHALTLSGRWADPRWLTVGATVRLAGSQFEDDLNTLPLGGHLLVDLSLSRALARWAEAFVAVENLFDTTYAVGRTTGGVIAIGAPRLVRGGVRLAF